MKRILVVDDEFGIGDAVADLLNDEGYRVEVARNGRDALAHLAEQGPVELFLVDRMMPIMDGAELVAALRGMSEYEKTPIVLMSALAQTRAVEGFVVDGFLRKPFDLQKLLAMVTALIGPP